MIRDDDTTSEWEDRNPSPSGSDTDGGATGYISPGEAQAAEEASGSELEAKSLTKRMAPSAERRRQPRWELEEWFKYRQQREKALAR